MRKSNKLLEKLIHNTIQDLLGEDVSHSRGPSDKDFKKLADYLDQLYPTKTEDINNIALYIIRYLFLEFFDFKKNDFEKKNLRHVFNEIINIVDLFTRGIFDAMEASELIFKIRGLNDWQEDEIIVTKSKLNSTEGKDGL